MNNNIKLEETFTWSSLKRKNINISKELFSERNGKQVFLISSEVAALDIIFSYYRECGYLKDKNAEIWVPERIGFRFYNTLQKKCFPSIVQSDVTKGIIVYHHYGYPQNMDKIISKARDNNWFIIEDCAHALMSYYNGKRVGFLGDVGIFDFSTFFPSLMGGAIVTDNNEMGEYIKDKLENDKTWGKNFFFIIKLFYEKSRNQNVKLFWRKWGEMSYNIYDSNYCLNPIVELIVKQKLFEKALGIRSENKDFFLNELSHYNIFNKINDHESVTPYVIPLIAEENQQKNILRQLSIIGVETSINHFDVNRDMINPNFVKCVCIPVHGGINQEYREKIVEAVIKGINCKS